MSCRKILLKAGADPTISAGLETGGDTAFMEGIIFGNEVSRI